MNRALCLSTPAIVMWLLLLCPASRAAEKKEEADKGKKREVTHVAVTTPLDQYCIQKDLAKDVQGTGPVRTMVIGKANLPEAKKVIQMGEQTLQALDIWTGGQKAFVSAENDPKELYYIILFVKDQDYLGFIDYLRQLKILGAPDGRDDLTKALLNFSGPRTMVIVAQKVLRHPDNFAIHCVTCMAINAFFLERGDESSPAWLHEGLSAELQRTFCKGQVLWSSISYEMSSPEMQGNWAQDVANMIKKNDKMLRPASQVLEFNLASLPGAHYKLMWSLCKLLVQTAKNKKGPKNKFLMLLEELAAGTQAAEAIKKVYGVADPKLTRVWFNWALAQK